ncbi:MAG: hypothetical protein AB4063_16260 [Crocosphaera sp.]
MTPLLIRHPRILLPNGGFLLGDILIEGGKLVQVSSKITPLDWITVVNATGLTLLPAFPTVWVKSILTLSPLSYAVTGDS